MKPVTFNWSSTPIDLFTSATMTNFGLSSTVSQSSNKYFISNIPTQNGQSRVAGCIWSTFATNATYTANLNIFGQDQFGNPQSEVLGINASNTSSAKPSNKIYSSISYFYISNYATTGTANTDSLAFSWFPSKALGNGVSLVFITVPFICDVYKSNPQYSIVVENYNAGTTGTPNSLLITPQISFDKIPSWVSSGNMTSSQPSYSNINWQSIIDPGTDLPYAVIDSNQYINISMPITGIKFSLTSTSANDAFTGVIMQQGAGF